MFSPMMIASSTSIPSTMINPIMETRFRVIPEIYSTNRPVKKTIGKPQGSDLASNKPTYPSLLGLEGAKLKLAQLHQDALSALLPFGDDAKELKALADFIVQRDH